MSFFYFKQRTAYEMRVSDWSSDVCPSDLVALQRSPLAPKGCPKLPAMAGVSFATAACGIKVQGRPDLCLMVLDPGSTVAGVLTRSKTASAPVDWCRAQLPRGRARAIIVNSGTANAFPGNTAQTSVTLVVEALAAALGCRPTELLPPPP